MRKEIIDFEQEIEEYERYAQNPVLARKIATERGFAAGETDEQLVFHFKAHAEQFRKHVIWLKSRRGTGGGE